MTATAAAAQKLHLSRRAPRARTGGPHDDEGPKILEHVLGWTLVVVLALFVTGTGLM
ncbi:SCO1431 family membrane protein [Streptomyces sp. NBC_01218]|uniref:SCO1431 family membrane protein n=1 Tax=Streptomyces sp. NBC_01218 TaxID=2903780 RepID=UPI002E15437C|nr:SCO1431 family membrane protein [Streptomyces sp. NBC_01218]